MTEGNALVGTQTGDRLPFSPEEKGAVWVEYTFPREVAGGHVYGRFQWTYTGNMLNGVSQPRIAAARLPDLRISRSASSPRDWEIYAYVDNLTNERAIIRD